MPDPRLLQAIQEFNAGHFFEQHEIFEELWREEKRITRQLYQGLLQVGVAFHHLKKQNYHGATTLLERGLTRLKPFSPESLGIDVAVLITALEKALTAIVNLGSDRVSEFDWSLVPKIKLK